MFFRKLTYVVSKIFMFILISSCEEKSSLTFVIDKTYSMRNDINQVMDAATDIMNIVHKKNTSQIENVVLVTFDDPGFNLVVKTNDLLELQRHLYAIEVIGNYDCPEMSLSGTRIGLQESLPGSYVYVFTDDDPKDYQLVDEVKNLAQKKQNQVVFVITPNDNCESGGKSFKEYYKIAAATYGQVFRLTEKSDVKSVMTYVEETISGQRTPVTSKLLPPNEWSDIDFVIDDKTEYGIVSTSGEGVTLIVKKSPSDYEKLTWLGNVKIIKLKSSGDYTVRVKGSGTTSVMVFGRTDFTFKHGFSVFRPTSLNHTTAQPISGQKSYLSIKIIDKEGDVDVKIARILNMDENLIVEKSLEVVNKKMKLYVTAPFEPPTSTFKIEIIGYSVKSNKTIIRKSQTPIEPQSLVNTKPIPPEVAIEEEPLINAEYDEPLELKCKVTAYPKPDIIWTDQNSGDIFETKVSPIELNYQYVSILEIKKVNKNNTYKCKAVNSQGEGQKVIKIETKRKTFFDVLEIPKDTNISYENSGKLKCKVSAFPSASVTWYRNGTEIKEDEHATISDDSFTLTIKNMQLEAEGQYMCEIRNELNRKLYHANVTMTGVDSPQLENVTTNVRVKEGSPATINCRVTKGRPKPSITWFYNNAPMKNSKIITSFQEVIHFPSVSRNEAGIYKCEANNIIGNDSLKTVLIVVYAPSIRESKRNFFERNGTYVTFPCEVDSVPASTVTWMFGGKPIMDTRKHVNVDNSLSFVATWRDTGNFTCSASNAHGTVSKTTKVDVYVPPTIFSKSKKVNVLMGKIASLPCISDGYPKPEIKWKFVDKNIKRSPKVLSAKEDGSIEILKIKTFQSGVYICTATNVGGSTNITYEVIVETPPDIENILPNKMLRAVNGDAFICIPCNATGTPKPVISWLKAGYPLALDEMSYFDENGTLCIGNVDNNVQGDYTCKAENYLGSDYETFYITVDDFPKPGHPTTRIMAEIGKPTTVECNVPHLKTDQIRWYKKDQYITEGDFHLDNPKTSDAGVYTCRIYNFKKSVNGYLEVLVGYKPRFYEDEVSEFIDFEIGYLTPLDCSADGLPNTSTRWWYNSKIINYLEDTYFVGHKISDRGEYICVVSNDFGNITRRFVVESDECMINTKTEFSDLHPIILTTQLEWPTFEKLEGHIRIPSGEEIFLYCPSGFKNTNTKEHTVSCYRETEFKLNGSIVKFADLTCQKSSKPVLKKTGRRCLSLRSELIQFGYKIHGKFLKVYELCFDKVKKISVYAKQNIDNLLADFTSSNTEWFNSELLPMDFESLYNCSKQIKNIHSVTFQWLRKDDGCCFSKRHLVNPRDVFPGVAQTSTYSHLNVIPHWSTCNEENWDEVESRIRLLATNYGHSLEVWTGISDELTLPDGHGSLRKVYIRNGMRGQKQIVPLYVWKVVRDPIDQKSLAIVQVNVPDLDLTKANPYVICEDICSKVTWMTSETWHDTKRGYTYCCSLQDFSKASGIHSLFIASNDKVLDSIPESTA